MSELAPSTVNPLSLPQRRVTGAAGYAFRVLFSINFRNYLDRFLLTGAANIDLAGRSITLTRGGTTPPPVGMPPPAFPISAVAGKFTFEQPTPASLVLDGELGGRKVQMKLTQCDLQNFLLMTRGFDWVQEYPFNR